MVLKTPKGIYNLTHNFRDAFNMEDFLSKYIEEVFDKDLVIVGDISSGILRLKGFDSNPSSKSYVGLMEKYFNTSYVIGSPFFILKRIENDEECNKIEKDKSLSEVDTTGFTITPIEKENFDKESLVLKSTPKNRPHIVLDLRKINELPRGYLPQDLKEEAIKENNKNNQIPKSIMPKEDENTQVYVSSSSDFDPSKKENRGHNFNNKNFIKNNHKKKFGKNNQK